MKNEYPKYLDVRKVGKYGPRIVLVSDHMRLHVTHQVH